MTCRHWRSCTGVPTGVPTKFAATPPIGVIGVISAGDSMIVALDDPARVAPDVIIFPGCPPLLLPIVAEEFES